MVLTCLENRAAHITLFVRSSSVEDLSAVLLAVAVDDPLDSCRSVSIISTAA